MSKHEFNPNPEPDPSHAPEGEHLPGEGAIEEDDTTQRLVEYYATNAELYSEHAARFSPEFRARVAEQGRKNYADYQRDRLKYIIGIDEVAGWALSGIRKVLPGNRKNDQTK